MGEHGSNDAEGVTLVSHPSPDGSVLLLSVPPDGRFTADFVDEEGVRDITGMVPDLVLLGLAEFARRSALAAEDAVGDDVVVGRVVFEGEGVPVAVFAHPAAQVVQTVVLSELIALTELGAACQITAGVQEEGSPNVEAGVEHPSGEVSTGPERPG